MPFILLAYLLEKCLVRCGVILAFLLSLYVAVDYTEVTSLTGSAEVYRVYWYKLPEIASHLLPLVLTAGVLLTVTHGKCTGEWVALQLAGISTFRLFLWLMLPATLLLPITFFNCHFIAPAGVAKFERAIHHASGIPMTHFRIDNWIVSKRTGAQISLQRAPKGRASQLRISSTESGKVTYRWRAPQRADTKLVRRTKSPYSSFSTTLKDVRGISTLPPTDGNGDNPPTGMDIMVPQSGINGIRAASVTSLRLHDLAKQVADRGGDAAPLQATVALRHGTAAAMWLVPFLALLILQALQNVSSSLAAAFLAIIVSAAYWLTMAFSWGLVSALRWPAYLIPIICICGFTAAGGIALKLIHRR